MVPFGFFAFVPGPHVLHKLLELVFSCLVLLFQHQECILKPIVFLLEATELLS